MSILITTVKHNLHIRVEENLIKMQLTLDCQCERKFSAMLHQCYHITMYSIKININFESDGSYDPRVYCVNTLYLLYCPTTNTY